jgi:hypothetical protein
VSARAQILWAVLALVLLFAIGVILTLVRRRRLRGKYGLLWLAVGVALIPLAVLPDAVDRLAEEVGVFYGPTVIMLAAIGLLLLLAMHFSWELSRLEERSRTLAEEVALLRAELDERVPPPETPPRDGEG